MATIHQSSYEQLSSTSQQASSLSPAVAAARDAGLHYVSDLTPGISRKRAGKHFSYIGLDGKPVHDQQVLQRIHSLGIPPAWRDVWICPQPQGHIQATGRDAKGRKQYRYHPAWRRIRDETKYDRMSLFGKVLPRIREQVAHDLALRGLPRAKVLATIVRLLDLTSIRVGNEEYARSNHSYGVTTLKDRHVDISSSTLRFHFKGKSGKKHEISVQDRQLARIVRHCRDLPGQELFQYLDEQQVRHAVTSDDVNAYLQEISGHPFTAKDFRTWTGTVATVCALQDVGEHASLTEAKKNVVHAISVAARHLGNTPAICRKSYVHPEIINAYLDGKLLAAIAQQQQDRVEAALQGLRPDEISVLVFLDSLSTEAP